MKKQMLVLAVTLMMVFASIVPALAQDATGTLELTGGSLSVVPAAVAFVNTPLTGAPQTVAGTTTAWSANDPTGSGSGWNVTVAATVPTNALAKTIPLTGFYMTLLDAAVTPVEGNTKPVSSFTTATALTVAAQKLVSAALDAGMGSYNLVPTFTLDVPAETYSGIYTSTITVGIVSGP